MPFLEHLGPLGQFLGGLGGLAAFLGAVATVWKFVIQKWASKTKTELIEATSYHMQSIIRASLEREALRHAPADYYTLDIEFEGGLKMAVPMFSGTRMLVSENIEMAVQDHNADHTELGLWCDGFGAMKKHFHAGNCETVHVERGTVTHVESGHVYRAGDTWVIEPGEWHRAVFQDCYCRIIHRPPLLTGAVRPVNLGDMPRVFPP